MLKDFSMLEDMDFLNKLACWFHSPGTYKSDWEEERFEHGDDIWHHHEVFSGDKILIETSTEWYESPRVPNIYKNHKYLFNQNMNLGKPFEYYYEQNADTGEFRSQMEVDEDLPSDNGSLWIEPDIKTKSAPSGENNFAMVDYTVSLYIEYGEIPGGIKWLPRVLAYPLNSLFRYYFIRYVGEEMLEYDIEYARERVREYWDYVRKYHGEEPIQTKSRQAHFESPYEGTFFE